MTINFTVESILWKNVKRYEKDLHYKLVEIFVSDYEPLTRFQLNVKVMDDVTAHLRFNVKTKIRRSTIQPKFRPRTTEENDRHLKHYRNNFCFGYCFDGLRSRNLIQSLVIVDGVRHRKVFHSLWVSESVTLSISSRIENT